MSCFALGWRCKNAIAEKNETVRANDFRTQNSIQIWPTGAGETGQSRVIRFASLWPDALFSRAFAKPQPLAASCWVSEIPLIGEKVIWPRLQNPYLEKKPKKKSPVLGRFGIPFRIANNRIQRFDTLCQLIDTTKNRTALKEICYNSKFSNSSNRKKEE